MNLKKWLHVDYIHQVLKKSRALLAILLFLFPLIVSLMQISQTSFGVINLLDNNIFVTGFMYVIPILLSFIFFSFVYKKKKVDFMLSMPLSRRQIFVSSTVCGIFLIIFMFAMNIFFLFLLTAFYPQVTLSLSMVWDYFLLYTLGYIYVFTLSNIAMSIAGNLITQIVVTFVLLFFVPFVFSVHQVLLNDQTRLVELKCNKNDKWCSQIYYEGCEAAMGVKNCNEQAKNGYYYTTLDRIYTPSYSIPVQNVFSFLDVSVPLYQPVILFQTFLMSIIFAVIGYFTFRRRKMEECETSFVHFKTHILVKSLSVLPFILIVDLLKTSFESTFILLLVLLAYYYIYDFITRRSLTHPLKTFFCYLFCILLCYGYYYGMEAYLQGKQMKGFSFIKEQMSIDDILSFKLSGIDSVELGYASSSLFDTLEFSAKDQIQTLLQYAYQLQPSEDDLHYISFTLALKNHSSYTGYLSLTNEQYEQFMALLKQDKTVQNEFKVSSQKLLGVSFLDHHYLHQDLENIKPLVMQTLSSPLADINWNESIDVVVYYKHKLQVLSIPFQQNQQLATILATQNNDLNFSLLRSSSIFTIENTKNNQTIHDMDKITNVINTLKTANTKVDCTKDHLILKFYTNKNEFYYITNQTDLLSYFDDIMDQEMES